MVDRDHAVARGAALPDGGEAVARALTALAGEYGAALPRAAGDANELPDLVQGSRRVRRFRGTEDGSDYSGGGNINGGIVVL